MGLLTRFLRGKHTPIRDDPDFGPITYHRGIWTHVPDREDFGYMISVCASKAGPSDNQRAFLRNTRDKLAQLELAAKEFINSETRGEVDAAALSVYSLEIGDDEDVAADRFVLELSDADQNLIHRVTFHARQPFAYTCDD